MAENLDENAERAQFEQDVLKAAQDAMNLEAEANGSANKSADDAPKADDAADAAKAEEKTAEQPAAPSAEEILKQQLADANDRFVRLMAEFENFRRRNAKEQLELIETANGKLLEKLSEVQDNFERAFASENKAKDLEAFEKGMQMIYNQFAKVLTDAGLEHEVVVTMMELPPGCDLNAAHNPEFYERILRNILDAGVPFASVCFKDASGTTNPTKVYETFKRARKLLGDKVELRIHSHDTCGTGVAQYKAAIEGGADGVDLGRKPLSGGTAQPDLFSMFHALKGTEYKLALGEDSIVDDHIPELMEANNVAVECLKDYNFPPEARQITTDVIFSPMPGGALTANTLMMRETKTFHLFPKVIENMSECVRRGGFASSVTPVSQFYFQQAYMNTLNQAAGRGTWFKMTEGYGKMLLGYQGKTPCEPDPELVKIAADQFNMKPFKEAYPGIQCAEEILPPGIPAAKKLLEENDLPVTDETIFITGCLQTKAGNKGIEFLKGNRHIGVPKKDPNAAPAVDTKNMKAGAASTYRIALGNQSWDVQVSTLK